MAEELWKELVEREDAVTLVSVNSLGLIDIDDAVEVVGVVVEFTGIVVGVVVVVNFSGGVSGVVDAIMSEHESQ